jgi:uncharacterized protein
LRIVLVQSHCLMPRRLLKKLWTLHRRAVTADFGAGLAICFIPLPVHLIAAALIAIAWRINLPAMYGTTLLVNPVTCVPVYYIAYRVGATLLGMAPLAPDGFRFKPSWEWFEALQPVWKPFLVGCVACAVVTGLLGWLTLELLWRWHVLTKYRMRRETSSASAA